MTRNLGTLCLLALLGCPGPKAPPAPQAGPNGFRTVTLTATKVVAKKGATGGYLRYSFEKGKQVETFKVHKGHFHSSGTQSWETEVELGVDFKADLIASFGRLYGPADKSICDLGPMTAAQLAAVKPSRSISRAWTRDLPLVAGNGYVMARGKEFGNGYALIRVVSIPTVKWDTLADQDTASVTLEWKVVPAN